MGLGYGGERGIGLTLISYLRETRGAGVGVAGMAAEGEVVDVVRAVECGAKVRVGVVAAAGEVIRLAKVGILEKKKICILGFLLL